MHRKIPAMESWSWRSSACRFIKKTQKQSLRGVLRKRYSENTEQIYKRTPMPKCDFNKVALKLHFGMCLFLKICCIFSEHLLLRTPQVAAYEERLQYRFFPVSFPKFLQIFFKHTSGRLLRKEHWNSLKWCQYLSLLMFVSLVYQK